ncbi:MAG: hypothetical protein QOJ73_3877 [Streptosporangiaceae bacterium]|jgi:hypothetical protein|nr:hypothetical protein [Streptosporangiaceae bacterium]
MSARHGTLSRMRPALKPGLLPVWRDRDTLQIGIDPRRAVALTGMRSAAAVLSLLDGSRDRGQVIAAAAVRGIQADAADRVITLLTAAGTLCDFPSSTIAAVPDEARARLAAELATASLAHGDGDGGAHVLVRRQGAVIRVHGTGEVGSCIASLLAASGIGHVVSVGPAAAGPPPRGPAPGDWPPPLAGLAAPRRASGGKPPVTRSRAGKRPDLAVLVGSHDPEMASALVRDRIPHLAASAGEAIGVVGPLVVAGRSACLRCLDLTRSDRDPAWPLILAQMAGQQPDPLACDAPLAAAVAALAAAQAIAFIDRPAEPGATKNGTLELVLPDWQWRRRTWPPHRECGCGSLHPR